MRTHWLASYPKSGNTWFRVFLSNLVYPGKAPVDPNQLPIRNLIASARSPIHEIIGVPAALLTADEYDSLRPEVDSIIGRDWAKPPCLRKAHDAYTYLPDGRALMGKAPDFAAIYILRNPWDVAVSMANHWGISVERAVRTMCRDGTALDHYDDRVSTQLRQHLLSWSGHVESWLNAPLDLCLLRYEEMHSDPLASFERAVRFLGIDCSQSELTNAIEASRFNKLQKIEQERGFSEAPKNRRFFRKGQVGLGRSQLSDDDKSQLDNQHQIVSELLAKHGLVTL